MKKGLLCLGLLLVVVAVFSSVTGGMVYHTDPYCVFITYPEGRYIIGHEMEIIGHFYYDGEPIDPEWVNMSIRYHMEDKLWFNMTRANTGIYTASFVIAPEHLDEEGVLWVSVVGRLNDAQHERDYISELIYIYTEYYNAIDVTFSIPDPSDMAPRPGQVVDYEIWMTYLGELVDPDDGSMEAYIEGPDIYPNQANIEHVGTGHYQGTFTVPTSLMRNGGYKLSLSADFTLEGYTYSLPHYVYSPINVHMFSIWVHQIFVNETMTTLDLFVTDLDGDPVADASVYGEDDDLLGITDARGVIEISLHYPGVGPGTLVYHVSGYVEKEGISQSFTEYCCFDPYVYIISPMPEPSPPRDYTWSKILDDELPEDSDVSIRLQSYDGEEPLPGDRIIVSLFNEHEVLYYGDGITGPDGILSIPIHTPKVPDGSISTIIRVEFQRIVDNIDWHRYTYSIKVLSQDPPYSYLEMVIDPDGYIDVLPFDPGGTVEAWITISEADGEMEMAGAVWGYGDPMEQGAPCDPAWFSWIPRGHHKGIFKGYNVGGMWEDGRYKVTIDLPNFIPGDEEIYIVGYVRFLNNKGYYDTRYVLLENITVVVDQPPSVAITIPVTGGIYNGTIDLSGTAFDDQGIVRVEISIDDGPWSIVEGATAWTYSLNTVSMTSGDHTMRVRAWDVTAFTQKSTTFVVDQPPSVTVNTPIDDVDYHKMLEINGAAEDDVEVLRIELRIDGGEWITTDGTDDWSYTIDTRDFDDGTHMLECRAFDKYTSSRTFTVKFSVSNPDVKVSTPGLPSTIVALAILSVAGTLIWNEDRKRP